MEDKNCNLDTVTLLMNVVSKSNTSDKIEIEEIYNDETSASKSANEQITDKLLQGSLTFSDYTEFMGDSNESDNEDDIKSESPSTSKVSPEYILSTEAPAKPVRRRKNILRPALQGLVGEANLRWARGDAETAEKMCLEVIRQVPTASEPFFTLAQIYETKNPEKSLQYSLIAAHLSPKNAGQWIEFADRFEQRGDYKQVVACLAKAVNADPKNKMLHLRRLSVYELLDDTKNYFKACLRTAILLDPEEYETILKYALIAAEEYYRLGDIVSAKTAMECIFQKCSNHITIEHVNCMLDILISSKEYERILSILVEYCGITIEAEKKIYAVYDGDNEEKLEIISYTLQNDTLIDIETKFYMCLIHLKQSNLFENIIQTLLGIDFEKNGDLIFDIAEALLLENYHAEALVLLDKLLKTEKFSMAAVWLRHAECLQACRRFDDAIKSYKQVIELAPQLAEVRITLSTLLREQGRLEEAFSALAQEKSCDVLDNNLLYERCTLLRRHSKIRDYIHAGVLMLSRHCPDTNLAQEVAALDEFHIPENLLTDEKEVFTFTFDRSDNKDKDRIVPIEAEWNVFRDLVHIAFIAKDYDLMERITLSGMQSKLFMKTYKKQIEFLAILSCIYSNDSYTGYDIIRLLCLNQVLNKKMWNLYNLIIQRSDDCRHNRFLMRLLTRCCLNDALHTLHANNCLVAGTYKYALSEYTATYKVKETPLVAFLTGITLIQMSCQKFSAKKHSLVVQGLSFLNQYKKKRGKSAVYEVDYNFGRTYHQLGILSLAIHHYKKVLEYEHPEFSVPSRNIIHLKREAAFNISLCYNSSGAKDLALMYIRKHIVI